MKKVYLSFFFLTLILGCTLSQIEIKQREEYLYRAEAYYTNKKYMNALQQLEYALNIDPDCKRAIISKGWTLYYLGKYDNAEDSFLSGLELDDSDAWLHYGLGSVYYKKGLKSIQKIAETLQKIKLGKNEKEKLSLEKKWTETLDRYAEEKKLWFEKSLNHLQKALEIAPEIIDLHKLVSLNYMAQGKEFYLKAIESMDRYLSLLQTEWKGMDDLKKDKQIARLQVGIKELEKEKIDILLENLENSIQDNRDQYKTAQAVVAECYYLLCLWEKEELLKSDISKEKRQKHQNKMQNYAEQASKRLKMILAIAPEMANHYRNLAGITYLQGKPEEASKYLQEYLDQYPLADPKKRAQAKVQIEAWKGKEKKE